MAAVEPLGPPPGDVPADGLSEVPSVGPARPPVNDAVRAQILATEHWSLLGTRSTMWSEVMSRITIHLTVSSAALVVLALVAQATDFGPSFQVLSLGLTSAVLVLGTLTGVRVMNASQDDVWLIIGMNRLRRAYISLDPGLAEHFVTSWEGGEDGLMRTYLMGGTRSTLSHVLASTAMFMTAVNTIVAGTLGALVANAAGAAAGATVAIGAAGGLLYLLAMLEVGRRTFASARLEQTRDDAGPGRGRRPTAA